MNEIFSNKYNLPLYWTIDKVKSACENISVNGIKIKQKDYLQTGMYPIIDQGQEIIGGYHNKEDFIIPGDPPFIVFGDHTKVKKYINFKFIAGADGIKVLKSLPYFLPKLFYYFLGCISLPEKGYARHFQFLANSDIPLPPLPEQRAIVAKIEQLFSELDSGVENLKKAQAQLKVYRQAFLKWAFEGKLTEEWRKQQNDLPTAETLLAQIKSEREEQAKKSGKPLKPITPISDEALAELPKLPEGWIGVKIDYLTLGVEYGTSAKSQESGKVPVLRMGNIQDAKFNWDDLVFTDDEEEINKYILKKNDVLFNRTNSPELVGKTAIYKGDRKAIFAGYLIRINQITSIINSDYLNYFLNSYYAKKHGAFVKTDGVNQSNINGTKLVNYPIPICTLPEQNQIVQEIEDRLSVCDKLEETIAQSLQQAESLRQSILKKAFSGQLLTETELEETRKVPDWEPAEKLLERIKAEKEAQKIGKIT